MAIKTFTTGEVLTAANTNTYLANSGLVYIATKTFAATSTLTCSSVFSSTYDNYVAVVALSPTPSGYIVNAQMLSGATPATTNYFYYEAGNTWAGVADVTGSSGGSSWFGLRSFNYIFATMSIRQPFTTNYTSFSSEGIDDTQSWQSRGVHKTASSYDGIQFTVGGGTMTGTITFYGFRKA